MERNTDSMDKMKRKRKMKKKKKGGKRKKEREEIKKRQTKKGREQNCSLQWRSLVSQGSLVSNLIDITMAVIAQWCSSWNQSTVGSNETSWTHHASYSSYNLAWPKEWRGGKGKNQDPREYSPATSTPSLQHLLIGTFKTLNRYSLEHNVGKWWGCWKPFAISTKKKEKNCIVLKLFLEN